MFGYVGDETEDVVSLTRSMTTRLETWYDVRTYGARWLRPEQGPHIAGGVHERCIFSSFSWFLTSCSDVQGGGADAGSTAPRCQASCCAKISG